MMERLLGKIYATALLILIAPAAGAAERDLFFHDGNGNLPNYDFVQILDLEGTWKFETGDDLDRRNPEFNDRKWADVFVPSAWEDEGFPGYDGFAWYRRIITLPKNALDQSIFLYLGYIDDADEVYINGHLIGRTGSFPPFVNDQYFILRRYLIPMEYLNPKGTNVIAIRVYDSRLDGGILRGAVGLYAIRDMVSPDQDLTGLWKFRTGDRSRYSAPDYDDAQWNSIQVPASWETWGYGDYDGYAWYRKQFRINPDLAGERIILTLGRIDDYDEVYFNGHRIGGSEQMENAEHFFVDDQEWRRLRAYYLPADYINYSGDNIIAVRVYDGYYNGGIYEGPVGLYLQSKFKKAAEALSTYDNQEVSIKELLRLIFEGMSD